MKRLVLFILIMAIGSSAYATVSVTVYRADGLTLLPLADPCIPNVYRPIMVGTHLTIIVDSNADGYWDGELTIWDTNQDYGSLFGRGYSEETFDWAGSRFPAAGEMATVFELLGDEIVGEEIHSTKGFQFTAYEDAIAGDWFILDYNATGIGSCPVVFFDRAKNPDYPVYQLSFTHVRTRDFDDDGIVNFNDFVLLGINWRRTDCQTQENCSGTDLDANGNVDFDDLKMFADFWLERTR
jgi:hypothetical protein